MATADKDTKGVNIPDVAVSDELTLHPVVRLIIQSFDYEYLRKGLAFMNMAQDPNDPGATDPRQIGVEYYGLYMGVNFFTFFTGRSVEQLTERFFSKETIRDFHLNFVERVSTGMTAINTEVYDEFFKSLVFSIGRSKPDPNATDTNSLISKETLQSLHLPPEDLRLLLQSNFWLVVLYVLLLNFQHTNVFSEFIPSARGSRG